MSRFTVVFDACVLYPAPLRDLLMRLAVTDLFKAHWTDKIHEEWIGALLRTGQFDRDTLERTRNLMDRHVRDAKVHDFELLIDGLDLPDPDDRHVLAAAIRCNADAIVTFNLRDFPVAATRRWGVDVIHPDDFVCYQLDMKPTVCCSVIKAQRQALRNPPVSVIDFLMTLRRQQLPQTAAWLEGYAAFLE